MKRLITRVSLFCLLLVLALPGYGREAEGLYQAEVPVKGQGSDERTAAYAAAMAQVIIKLTGDRTAPQLPRLANVMASAQKWVQQYRYQALDVPALKAQGYTRLLVMQFDEKSVSQALVAAAVPLWGRTRPDLLVWLAVEDGSLRSVLAANDATEVGTVLDINARRRALPVLLPAVDLEDQKRLSFADLWADARQPIMNGSKRYGANAVLVGRISRIANGNWQGRWSLYQGDEVQRWSADDVEQRNVVASGVDGAADRFARRYAQLLTSATANQVALLVTDVTTLAAYAQAQQYLLSLDLITKVQVTKVQGSEVLFTLDVRGDADGIDRAINLGGTLRRSTAMRADNQTLVYQLLP